VPATVLVVDDEESFHRNITRYLTGYRRLSAYGGTQALEILGKQHVDVVLLDLNLPDINGLEVLDRIRFERDDVEVIMCTSHTEVRYAVDAMKRGAFDFLVKSFENYQALREHIERALDRRRTKREALEDRTRQQRLRDAFALLEGTRSPAVQSVVRVALKVADTPLTVLIEGESGVGKEILARLIHARSDRADKPFVTVNVSSVPATLLGSYWFGHTRGAFTGADRAQVGKFELASGGTIFLDEVGELDGDAQVKLLRVLQEREIERLGAAEPTPIDVRVIAATNKRLADQVKLGQFREDLYFRLNVLRLTMPPLRDRMEDLPDLARLLLLKHARVMNRVAPRIAPGAHDVLRQYAWPGNVRELENFMMRVVALGTGDEVREDDIPPEYWLETLNQVADHLVSQSDSPPRLFHLAVQQFQRYLIRLVIQRSRGNKRMAAETLGISHSTLKSKIRELGIASEPGDEDKNSADLASRTPPPTLDPDRNLPTASRKSATLRLVDPRAVRFLSAEGATEASISAAEAAETADDGERD
jgi:DNA-binding NtrC family response regulator